MISKEYSFAGVKKTVNFFELTRLQVDQIRGVQYRDRPFNLRDPVVEGGEIEVWHRVVSAWCTERFTWIQGRGIGACIDKSVDPRCFFALCFR